MRENGTGPGKEVVRKMFDLMTYDCDDGLWFQDTRGKQCRQDATIRLHWNQKRIIILIISIYISASFIT